MSEVTAPKVRILAPHKNQEGFVYIRVRRVVDRAATPPKWDGCFYRVPTRDKLIGPVGYPDDARGSRIISSSKAELGAETLDYLQRCTEEGLHAIHRPNSVNPGWGKWFEGWTVFVPGEGFSGKDLTYPTLKEAYTLYHKEHTLRITDEVSPPERGYTIELL